MSRLFHSVLFHVGNPTSWSILLTHENLTNQDAAKIKLGHQGSKQASTDRMVPVSIWPPVSWPSEASVII
jgi:hypothetical protein